MSPIALVALLIAVGVAVVLFGVLSGKGAQVTDLMPPSSIYGPATINDGIAGRDVAVAVLGTLPGTEPKALAERVTALMREAQPVAGARFTSSPGASAKPGYVVVVALADRRDTAEALCRQAPTAGNGALGGEAWLHVNAALCVAGKPVTAVSGRAKGVRAIDDKAFADLIGDVARALFPPAAGESRP
ncbi:MAG: hypothetical protein JNK11_10155 [Alphaproteobacteria bacterium]|nr:hypothetical protein [Alphaproteobacteria bacterium]